MAINPEVYITDIAFWDTFGKALEERGIQVDYPALCLYLPLNNVPWHLSCAD